ncbi:MAG: GIY-YIG nuclease family protein [Pseudanabaena sp. Salubria-1]|jgi:hypothetical protein|nr:GIY-YIG nuclease family protein [Pseudanabaena sp. Salubria-1]MCX5934353.1 GIY-YIG nuclease family protein [Pseudanabaena sp. LacPavin_0818_WC45_MAG_42_6]
MEWKSWSSVSLMQRSNLPNQSGIYVVVDGEEQVWYVGRAINLNARWNGKGHHRYKQLSRANNKRLYRIHWQIFPPDQLSEKEQKYIDLLKPHLNYSRVRTYARKAIQPNQEINRLLKTLNKKTMLFPDVRSVVVGYYTDVEENEDEEASLEEYICIVIAVHINDESGLILNSYNKSLSKRGNNLKGYWQANESNCGALDPEIQPALIPVFVIGNIVYEFVCFSGLIDKLGDYRSSLQNIQIAGQSVLALADLDILPTLITDVGIFSLRSEDYMRYRIPDLQSALQLNEFF